MFKKSASAFIIAFSFVALSCGGATTPQANTNTGPAKRVCDPISDTPTEAYKRLYAAVKSKDPNLVKAEMSKNTQAFAESLAQRQNNPVEKVYENGFTATTFSATLPQIRDERVAGCWAGVEVRNDKDQRWEDLPFVNEDGMWKFAIGELFGGSYESPGKSMDTREREATNVSRGNSAVPGAPVGNTNTMNANAPDYDGPQVDPIPKKK